VQPRAWFVGVGNRLLDGFGAPFAGHLRHLSPTPVSEMYPGKAVVMGWTTENGPNNRPDGSAI
jgi:hypothetical protein